MASVDPLVGDNAFKRCFKKFKSRVDPPNCSELPTFSQLGSRVPSVVLTHGSTFSASNTLKPAESWPIFRCTHLPGLVLIRNPFTPHGQLFWGLRCARDFARHPPQRTNLDREVDSEANFHWFESAQDDPSLWRKMRWSTLGYHHNWDTKVYSDQDVSPFPPDLAALTADLARTAGFPDFRAEAAIVNFYPLDGTLGGHTDHSEDNLQAPLVSISLGQSAIFLVGGTTKDVEPVPILLQSGDVVIMSGEARRAFHGIPRIVRVPQTSPDVSWARRLDQVTNPEFSERDQDFMLKYLDAHRININVRQVH
ncbi:hypothetical protein TCAL_04022 [Tigriopus californicus]|uniref:Fe2OG dioxygenase domain-containing protein n=1 Tax=Tigriopus californicus TaxID=6832 RepID=A0A553NDT5_TIGCA|nr:nucleic acid dioxygenase ALKBH1-like [Tigriopus californicus]TRY63612.1 hypothetical protein TCAL_04022 [Tigriopus californicus]